MASTTLTRAFIKLTQVSVCALFAAQSFAIDWELDSIRPTPCLDAVAPLLRSEMLQSGTHSVLQGMGRRFQFPASWTAGNDYYDQVYAIVYRTLSSDEAFHDQLSELSVKALLVAKLRRASPADKDYLRSFLLSKEGTLYREFMLEGATCQALFNGLTKRGVILSEDQRAISESWNKRFELKRKGFELAFAKLTPSERTNFDRGYKLLERLSKPETSHEREVEDKISLAAERSFLSVTEKIKPLVNDFAKSQR